MIRTLPILLLCFHVGLSEVRYFPDGFIFGAASASYQVEGAWNEDGKTESMWDRDTHQTPSPIADNSTGDVAADSYHLWERDVEMLREVGLNFYRFSLGWPRILPTGFPDQINQAGVDYYNKLIDKLLEYNITPVVTLYHWDLPQKLQDLGGWSNPHIVDWFGDFSRIAFELFGDRVKYWITINEPTQVCVFGYGLRTLAPRLNIPGVGDYICAKNVLLGHARAYHIYDEEFRPYQEGTIFITLSTPWMEPATEDDAEAAEITLQFDTGIYAHPIFTEEGDWPAVVKERVALKSAEQGFCRSRLPELTHHEIAYLRGTSDYLGINHYSTNLVNTNASVLSTYAIPSRLDDIGTNQYQLDEWLLSPTDRVKSVPWGFYKILMYLANNYGNPPIFVTENGLGTRELGLVDTNRITYHRTYLDAMLDAIDDGANVIAYAVWSLMDNFSWSFGYTVKYGLYEVDFTSAERTRTARQFAFIYKEIVRSNSLDPDYVPDTDVMTIDEGH